MPVSKTNQILINKIKTTLAQHVKNPRALTASNNAIKKIEGQHSKLKELYRIIQKVSSELNTLPKLLSHDKETKKVNVIQQKSQTALSQFNLFQSPEQSQGIYQSL